MALGNALLASGDRDGAAEHYRLAQIADGDLREGVIYDFAAHLAEADIQSPGADHVPEKPGFSQKPGFWLAFAVATAPESWEQPFTSTELSTSDRLRTPPGDGVTFAVYVESGQDMQPETRNPKLETYVDPRQDETARHWHPHTLDKNRPQRLRRSDRHHHFRDHHRSGGR